MSFETDCPRSIFSGNGCSALQAGEVLGDGLAVALWATDETERLSYVFHNHLKLSLAFSRNGSVSRYGSNLHNRDGATFCIAPVGLTTDWRISGRPEAFHLYFHRSMICRAIVNGLERDATQVEIPERVFFQDECLLQHIHSTFLRSDWREPANRLALTQAGYLALDHLLARYSTATRRNPIKGGLAPSALRRVTEFVCARLDTQLTISDIADMAGLSEFHFARMFKRSTGESPHSYVLRQRVDRAKRLLIANQMTLAEIAGACGYSSQSHFSVQFRNFTSVTPKRYRAMHVGGKVSRIEMPVAFGTQAAQLERGANSILPSRTNRAAADAG